MKHKSIIALLALSLTLVLAGCSSNGGVGGITAPKKISFVKQATSNSGTHVWVDAQSIEGSVSKDDIITAIYVLSNGKMTKYNIFDNDITLRKLSKLNDGQTIKLAKEQDKKYATTGAITEIKSGLKGKGQVGQESDFEDVWDIAVGHFEFFAQDDEKVGQNYNKIVSPNGDYDVDVPILSLTPKPINEDHSYGKAMIKHIKNTPYQAPKPQKIKVENATDNSGNKIISQQISYKGIEMFDKDPAEQNLYHYALKNQKDFLRSIKLREKFEDYDSSSDEAIAEAESLYAKLFKGQQYNLTKNVYGYHPYNASLELRHSFVNQKIYKARYIGYPTYRGHLITKAQNKTQKVEFSK